MSSYPLEQKPRKIFILRRRLYRAWALWYKTTMFTTVNAGDTAWMLMCAALAFLAIPGFGFFYGGLLPKKNPLSILLPCLLATCLVSLQWILVGYSLSFGPDHNGWIGTLAVTGLRGVGTDPNLEYAGTVPPLAFIFYHAMLAAVAVVILLAAFAERIKLIALCAFALLWTTIVYDPIAHWVWNVGGFLRRSDVSDFAGGAVVQLNAGVSALAASLVFEPSHDSLPSGTSTNPLFAALGGAMVWLGWFGLNAGSALSAGVIAANAVTATYIAAVIGGFTWTFLDGIFYKQASLVGLITGAMTGMIAVAASAGSTSIWSALGIGFTASICCYGLFVFLEKKTCFGTSHLIFCIHGIGGICGMMIAGQWLIQAKAVLAIAIYSFGMTYLLLKFIDYVIGLTPGPTES